MCTLPEDSSDFRILPLPLPEAEAEAEEQFWMDGSRKWKRKSKFWLAGSGRDILLFRISLPEEGRGSGRETLEAPEAEEKIVSSD
jgi:hypothetical protein